MPRSSPRQFDRPWYFFGRWFLVFIFVIAAIFPFDSTDSVFKLPLNAPAIPTAKASSTTVVISQVYGGGGNSGAFYKYDFIELFNRSNAAVSLNGWSVQYGSAASSFAAKTDLTGVTLQPGQYYLIQEAAGSSGVDLPTPDASGTVAMSATSAKVALVNTTTLLSCGGVLNNCFPNAAIIDLVGYGTSVNNYEGSPTANLSNTNAALRDGGGCAETDNNAADFVIGAPAPRNTASPLSPCGRIIPSCGGTMTTLQGTSATRQVTARDADGTVTQAAITNLTPSPAPGAITLGTISPAPGPGGVLTAVLTVNNVVPVGAFNATLAFTNTDSPTPQTATCSITINVLASPPLTPIYTIQGAARQSPLVNTTLATRGVVTGIKSNGFFMQDATGDGDVNTSDGIFVYTSSAPPAAVVVSHSVLVSGTVQEYAASSSGDAPLTELANVTSILDLDVGPTITPTVITADPARQASTYVRKFPAVIYDSANPGYNPAVNGLDFYESLEGMLVEVDNSRVVGPSDSYGEFVVVPDNGAGATTLNARGALPITATDFNPEKVMIGDSLASQPKMTVGDALPAPIIGPLDYASSNYKIQALTPLTTVDTTHRASPETLSPLTNPDQLRVASFNIENFYYKASSAATVSRAITIANQIVNGLGSPDILVVCEVQDDDGPTASTVVSATNNLNQLTQKIVEAGGPLYAYRQIDPVVDQDGGQLGGNIRQVFFYRTDRGLSFVDKPGGTAITNNAVNGDGSLLYSPGRLSPTDAAFTDSRKPLAGEFQFQGQRLIVIGNHFNSKGGDTPLYGAVQPPALSSETKRVQQATIVRNFVSQLLTNDPGAFVVVAGDLNDFEFSNPLLILKNGPSGAPVPAGQVLSDVVENISLTADRYSYIYEGNAQDIDHVLYSPALAAKLVASNIAHVNSDFPNGSALRTSDHEGIVADFDLRLTDCALPYLVTNDHDSGSGGCGTLSYALLQARNAAQPVTIGFNVSSVTVDAPLPAVTNTNNMAVKLNGGCSSVGGYGAPGVHLVGSGVSVGLTLTNNMVITGLALVNFTDTAISITGSNNQISCSWLGTATGTGSDSVAGSSGLRLAAGAKNNHLGQAGDPLSGNLIIGRGVQALIVPSGAQIKYFPGNRIKQM
jgi:predicted extracellular nuclease